MMPWRVQSYCTRCLFAPNVLWHKNYLGLICNVDGHVQTLILILNCEKNEEKTKEREINVFYVFSHV